MSVDLFHFLITILIHTFITLFYYRFQSAIDTVRSTLNIAAQAIRGEVVVTAEIMESINAIHDARVPKQWLYR